MPAEVPDDPAGDPPALEPLDGDVVRPVEPPDEPDPAAAEPFEMLPASPEIEDCRHAV